MNATSDHKRVLRQQSVLHCVNVTVIPLPHLSAVEEMPPLATIQVQGQVWVPSLVNHVYRGLRRARPSLATPSLAKVTKFGQTKFGQDQVWPDQVRDNIVRVCVKPSRAEGRRRLHTNTAYVRFSFQRAFMWSIAGRRPAMLHMKVC